MHSVMCEALVVEALVLVLVDALAFVLINALVFVLVDELAFVLVDKYKYTCLEVVQVPGHVLIEALVRVPVQQHF